MANLNLSQFTTKTLVEDADWVFVWDTANSISKKVSRNSLLNSGTLAGASAPITISQTWNDAAVAFAAMKIVAIDTNSAADSDFLELYSGTSTQPLRLDIQKTGQVNIYGTWTNSTTYERLSLSAPTSANAIIGTNKGSSGGTARGLDLHTDGAARMTIGTTGNVGIGTTSPTFRLCVQGDTECRGKLYVTQSTPTTALVFDSTTGGVHKIYAEALQHISFQSVGSNGNVGIGTTAPSSKLEVVGAVTVSTYIKVSPVAVTSLPDAATAGVGARAFVNDALAPVFGSAVANGGSAKVPVYSDGSAWYVG